VSDFSFGRIVLLLSIVAAGAGIGLQLPEVRRYMKVRQM
jgi:hypothetical protein